MEYKWIIFSVLNWLLWINANVLIINISLTLKVLFNLAKDIKFEQKMFLLLTTKTWYFLSMVGQQTIHAK